MTRTPTETVRTLVEGVCALTSGDGTQVDRLAALYAEHTDVRHPMAPTGDTPLLTRAALHDHFAHGPGTGRGIEAMRPVDLLVHATGDPEVVVVEVGYLVTAGGRERLVPNVFVVRVRDGLVVESRDYADHLGFAIVTGGAERLLSRLA